MQTKLKPLLVVTIDATSINIPVKKDVVQISNITQIFTAIHELQPCGIVLDYDYIGDHTEKILRRLKSNPFYNNIQIYCYKSRLHTKVDGLLKVWGVQKFIYASDSQPKIKPVAKIFNNLLESVVANKLADAGY